MSWLLVTVPILAVFAAYFAGKSAGRKEALLKQASEQQKEYEETDAIIDNNNNLGDNELDDWLHGRAKK